MGLRERDQNRDGYYREVDLVTSCMAGRNRVRNGRKVGNRGCGRREWQCRD